MRPKNPNPQLQSRWPHRLAVALACATFPLIGIGGLVTSYKAGMAVPDWPNTYGYNLFLYPWQTWFFGPWDLFIEHGHRLLGSLVGMITIALVCVAWRTDTRRWLRWLTVAALAAVIFQGLLGGLRVVLDEVLLAKIHGCFAPVFFGLTVALAIFTSRRWQFGPPPQTHEGAGRVQRLALLTTAFAYVQLVLGSQLRHLPMGAEPASFSTAVFFHLVMAVVVVVHVLLLHTRIWRAHGDQRALRWPAIILLQLVVVQLFLGGATWVAKYNWPAWLGDFNFAADYTIAAESWWQATISTAHVATGSLILVTSLAVSLWSLRLLRPAMVAAPVHGVPLEVAV